MLWKILTPFSHDDKIGWIPQHIHDADKDFQSVPAHYVHDRSRKSTNGRQWLDYFNHAWAAWFGKSRPGQRHVGYITSFPQLAVCTGILKRITFSRRPTVAWCFNLGAIYTGFKGVLASFAMKSANIIVVHSTYEIQAYSAWLKIPETRFRFVPLSIERYSSDAVEDIENPFIVAMGTANRDYRLLIEAVTRLELPTIIVSGPSAIEGIAVPDFVRVHSNLSLEECHALSKRARINVVPIISDDSASGQVTVLEAMMLGKAVIASDCAGTRDYIDSGSNGILVPLGDVDEMEKAISLLWNDQGYRKNLSRNAHDYVMENATFETVSVKMKAILDEVSRP